MQLLEVFEAVPHSSSSCCAAEFWIEHDSISKVSPLYFTSNVISCPSERMTGFPKTVSLDMNEKSLVLSLPPPQQLAIDVISDRIKTKIHPL